MKYALIGLLVVGLGGGAWWLLYMQQKKSLIDAIIQKYNLSTTNAAIRAKLESLTMQELKQIYNALPIGLFSTIPTNGQPSGQ